MNKIIKDIITTNTNKEVKEKELKKLKEDIELAFQVLSGEYKYCKECDDFYLSKSFTEESEIKPCDICVYSDPINSGGNEFKKGISSNIYEVCPKNHKKLIHHN